jgi:hypothetical protein
VQRLNEVAYLVLPLFAGRYSAVECDRDSFAKAATDTDITAIVERLHKMQTDEFLRPRVVRNASGQWHERAVLGGDVRPHS